MDVSFAHNDNNNCRLNFFHLYATSARNEQWCITKAGAINHGCAMVTKSSGQMSLLNKFSPNSRDTMRKYAISTGNFQ